MKNTLPYLLLISVALLAIVITNRLMVFFVVENWVVETTEWKWELYMLVTCAAGGLACLNPKLCNVAAVISCPLITALMTKSFSVLALAFHMHLSLATYVNALSGLLLACLYFVLYYQIAGKGRQVVFVGILLSVSVLPMAYLHTLDMLHAP